MIIEDDMEREGLPSYLSEIDEMVLMIQGFDLLRWMFRTAGRFVTGDTNRDFLTNATLTGDPEKDYFYLINDQYQPSICLKKGEWKRFRMVHNDVRFDTELLFGDTEACQVQLLAKDGVYLSPAPRELSTNRVYFTQSGRADILIKCDVAGTYEIRSWDHVENQENFNWIIGYLEVSEDEVLQPEVLDVSSADSEVDNIEITQFEPIRPKYLEDLLIFNTSEIDHFWRIEFGGGDNINGHRFRGKDVFPEEYQPGIDTLNEWDVVNIFNAKHPLHIHVNHFQIVDGHDEIGTDPLFTLPGDWHDTVAYDSRIRFVTDTFGGTIVLHCHILEHEDRGKMAVYYIDGGCNATDIDCIRDNSECFDSLSDSQENKGIGDFISEWLFENGVYSILIWSGIVIVVLLLIIFAYCLRCRSVQRGTDSKHEQLMNPMRKDGSGSYGSVDSESQEQDEY